FGQDSVNLRATLRRPDRGGKVTLSREPMVGAGSFVYLVLPGFPGVTYAECFIRGAHLDRGYERGRNAACLADQGPARFSDRPLALESRNAGVLVKKSPPEKSEGPF